MARAKHYYDNIDHSAENDVLRDGLEELYDEMVQKHELFDLQLIEDLVSAYDFSSCAVLVDLRDGSSYCGAVSFQPKDSLTRFVLEIPGEKETEGPQYKFIEIDDVAKISLDGEEVYPRRVDFEHGLTEQKIEISELDKDIAEALLYVKENHIPIEISLQEALIKDVLFNEALREKVKALIMDNEVLYQEDKEDILSILSFSNLSEHAIELYLSMDTLPREHFIDMIVTSFEELYLLKNEPKVKLDEKIACASGKTNSSLKECYIGKDFER